ncbi:retrovirus-related pol polyprotein from transposon TNT 1-94 [Tanacetum coccineum]
MTGHFRWGPCAYVAEGTEGHSKSGSLTRPEFIRICNRMMMDRYNADHSGKQTSTQVYQRYLFTLNHYTDAKDIWDNGRFDAAVNLTRLEGSNFDSCAAGYGRAQNRVGNANPGQARQVKCYNCNWVAQENGVVLDEEQLLFLAGGQDNAFDEDVDEQPVQDLALNVDKCISTLDDWQVQPALYIGHVIVYYPICIRRNEAEALQRADTRQSKALTVYLQYTASLSPGVLPTKSQVKPKVLAPGKTFLRKVVDTLRRNNGRSSKVERPLDRSLTFACRYTKHSQELLDYMFGTCPKVVQIVLWYLDSGCSKHMTGDRSRLMNFVKKFIGTVRFGNDHFGAIMGYGDYVIGDSVISRVYYVEGLGHNLFSVGQFCDSDLEVAFRKHSCYVRDTDGVELLKGSRGSNLYTISVEDMMKSSPICLLSKASKHKSWLWHRRLNHLNFGTINDLARKDLVRGLPRLKFEKDHLCSACQLGKSKKHTHKPKTENTNLEVLNTLHMDLCGPMRVQTINGKKYILVIVDDYSRFTWVKFLRSKDETPTVVIKFLKQIQVGLNKTVRCIRTDNGTEFVNKTLENLGKLQPRADIGIFIGYAPSRKGYRIYNKRTRQIMETIHVQFDELTEHMAPVQSSPGSAPLLNLLRPGPISSGLVPNPAPAIPYVPPTNKELEMLFQPMFDEYFTPPGVRQDPIPNVAQDPVIPTGPSVSIAIDLDAPSGSHTSSPLDHHSSSVHHGVAGEQYAEVNPFAAANPEPFVNVFAPDYNFEASSSREITIPELNQSTQHYEHVRKWTDSHPLDNIIGNPSRPVSTRKQLATDALWCFYNSVLSKVKTAGFKPCRKKSINLIDWTYGN